MAKDENDLKNLTLSPSSINVYFQDPRVWYFKYVLGIKEKETKHLFRGSAVHEIIEDLFMGSKYVNPKTYFKKNLDKKWSKFNLKKDSKEMQTFYKETELMLKLFAERLNGKINILCLSPKIKNKDHAWNYVKPKFRELAVKSENYNIRGYIDSVEEGKFDGSLKLIDYKTSSIYRHGISDAYLRQLKLYALMYYEQEGKYPTQLIIDYLKYGENFILPFNESLIEDAKKDIEYVRKNTQSIKIEDYPPSDHMFSKRMYEMCGKNGEKLSEPYQKYMKGEITKDQLTVMIANENAKEKQITLA